MLECLNVWVEGAKAQDQRLKSLGGLADGECVTLRIRV